MRVQVARDTVVGSRDEDASGLRAVPHRPGGVGGGQDDRPVVRGQAERGQDQQVRDGGDGAEFPADLLDGEDGVERSGTGVGEKVQESAGAQGRFERVVVVAADRECAGARDPGVPAEQGAQRVAQRSLGIRSFEIHGYSLGSWRIRREIRLSWTS